MGTVEDRWWTSREGGRVPRQRSGRGLRWRARYSDAEGRQRSRSFALKPDAVRFLNVGAGRTAERRLIDPGRSRTALSDSADLWLRSLSVRPSTRRTHGSHLRTWILPALGARTPASITPTDVRGLVRRLGEQLAPSTAHHVHGLLSSILRSAVEDGYLPRNPAARTGPGRPPRAQVRPLTVEQVQALIDGTPERLRVAVLLGAGCGLRIGEVLGLSVDSVDLDGGQVTVSRVTALQEGATLARHPPSQHMRTKSYERAGRMSWQVVDEGWGRRAADFATLIEPSAWREYLAVHRRLGLAPGERLLDLACGAGLAMEVAATQGAVASGIDASPRLVEVARLRNPGADLRVGDMAEPHFDAASFDVVTSFRGIWGTTPEAMAQVTRVLRPGGRVALTFWGDLKTTPGGVLFAPFRLATEEQVAHQSDMVALKHPGAAARFLQHAGLVPGEELQLPFVLEFADAEHYARGLAATGPGYEAIQTVGEEAFREACLETARPFVRDGLPIRAVLALQGIIGTTPD